MKVTFASSSNGKSYFEKFIADLTVIDRAIVLAVFKDISVWGLKAKGCDFRQIESKLWEIKIKASTGGYRFFYVLINLNHLHVLHSYRKQGQRAPLKELQVARKRLKDVLNEK
jgi:phage-related protein